MSWKKLVLVPFLAFTPVLVGCGADCEDICERENDDCEGTDRNCGDTCGDIEELNEKADCEDSWDEVVECIDDADDVCDENICNSESTAWLGCVTKYCASHQGSAECLIDF